MENISGADVPEDLDSIMSQKTELLSVLLPPVEDWTELTHQIFEQARALLPDDIYFDDGTLETQAAAFTRYRFCLISDDRHGRQISQPFIRSVGFHTVALYNGFVEIGAMVFNGIADFEYDPFDLVSTMTTITKHNEQLGALWHYQRIIQDQLLYRYNRPFEERLLSQACSLCRILISEQDSSSGGGYFQIGSEPATFADQHLSAPSSPAASLVFVGIYSARGNFDKRQAVRETWGKLLWEEYGLRYMFFLGEPTSGAAVNERRVRREALEYQDIVFLDVAEGYRMNSKKGLMFLEWIALRSNAAFLLKTDDDVYLRPAPLLRQLLRKPAAQYVWGYFDYISPVPREESDHFYSSEDDFPFEVFAPYPRGVVRVLSMDVVRLLAEASRDHRLRMIYGDDPCIGVHLRQLLFDPDSPLPSLTMDDFDNRVFAMEPSCHPNLWSKVTNRTWAIHHVTPEQIHCMWSVDRRLGYYSETPQGVRHDASTQDGFPDLCECTPDPSFEERTDLDNLKQETDRILFR